VENSNTTKANTDSIDTDPVENSNTTNVQNETIAAKNSTKPALAKKNEEQDEEAVQRMRKKKHLLLKSRKIQLFQRKLLRKNPLILRKSK
jgi:hypothetical protein